VRVLIVSYYFPPAAGGGVQRVLKWAKYLPQSGVEVHVLTPDDPKWIDSGGGLRVQPGTHVHRTKNYSPRSVRPSTSVAQARSPLSRLGRKLLNQPRRVLFPDIHVGWSLTAVRAGVKLVRECGIDVIVSTSPPETDHLIARRIARKTGIPWVADYRDSWLDLPHLRLDRPAVRRKHAVAVRTATRWMRAAAAITTVSEPLAADLRRRHPETPVTVIENGVDLADLAGMPEPPANERFTAIYTGNFFGRQSPEVLLDALELLARETPAIVDDVSVRMIGGVKPGDDARIAASPALSAIVSREPMMDYDDTLATQRSADLLLLYVAPGPGSAGVFTGKVFEYVAAARPVLAMVPAGNVCIELLTSAGSGIVVDPTNAIQIAAALREELALWNLEGRRSVDVPETVLQRVSRQGQAKQLVAVLNDARARR